MTVKIGFPAISGGGIFDFRRKCDSRKQNISQPLTLQSIFPAVRTACTVLGTATAYAFHVHPANPSGPRIATAFSNRFYPTPLHARTSHSDRQFVAVLMRWNIALEYSTTDLVLDRTN